ncbi:regucalcin [Nematostella vectensis]|uniref:regucalcin n=1 Tax=Nematostella vectensis TaxID=45351 RepID=UPI00138FF77C|nr:regucalcin [Nematostella vectensis]
MAEISVLEGCFAQLGEAPHWDEQSSKLVYVDILGKSVHLYDAATGKDTKYDFDDTVGAAVPRKTGGSVVVLCGRSYTYLDLETGKKEVVATVDEDKPNNRFNDGKCDPAGRFWAGSMGPEPRATEVVPEQGSLFCLHADGAVTKHDSKITISNGLGWSPDNKTMYFIDSIPARCVYAYDFDMPTGSISNRRIAVQVDPLYGVPDGMSVDSDGMLWVAMYNGGKVVRYDPSNGKELSVIEFPVSKTTSCCWMGPDYDQLIVTSERCRLSQEEKDAQPLAGSVFRVKNLGAKGLPSIPFNG